MKTMWTIAWYNPYRQELTITHNGMMWAHKLTAVRHYNMMKPEQQKDCQIVEVPAWLKGRLSSLRMFLREDEETRKETLED